MHASAPTDVVNKSQMTAASVGIPPSGKRPFGPMLGNSLAMRRVYQLLTRVAPTDASILLVGPTGCGKELAAQAIHDRSSRRLRPMLAINCGALPANLIESELFGHVKGAFTGADRSRAGIFERAHDSTLLLDEITEMPMDLQVRLLRVLETRTITRVGGEHPMDIDVRIVAATNRNPAEALREGRLREDLLYRLSGITIQVPSLRERDNDIDLLANQFLSSHNQQSSQNKTFAPQAIEAMRRYDWPGNVRELKNVVQCAFILANDSIDLSHLGPVARNAEGSFGQEGQCFATDTLNIPVGTPIREIERQMIIATLTRFDNDKPRTALALGISLKTLYIRLNQYRATQDTERPAS